MDVLALDLNRLAASPELPRWTVLSDLRRRLLALAGIARRAGGSPGSGPGPGGAAATRRMGLLTYTAASIGLGIGVLAWSTATIELWPAIDPGLPGTALAESNGGLLLWLVFGLIGSLRVLRTPDGGTMTFHMPFIGAAMILGGPTAGAWVAFLSTIERRELETQPWYGVLANHSVLAISAVLGGLTTMVVGRLLGADGVGGPALVAASAGVVVLAVVSTAMGALTVMLRDGLTRRHLLGILWGQVGRITTLEIALALMFALTYAEIGWWTTPLIAGAVLVLWVNNPPPPVPQGLLSAETFRSRIGAGLGNRNGHGTLLHIDINDFGAVNGAYGMPTGDEVLHVVSTRLAARKRATDLACRFRADEFGVFLPGLCDSATALRKAAEMERAITEPIATRAGAVRIAVSIGLRVIAPDEDVSTTDALRQAEQALFRGKRNGGTHLYDPEEPPRFE